MVFIGGGDGGVVGYWWWYGKGIGEVNGGVCVGGDVGGWWWCVVERKEVVPR